MCGDARWYTLPVPYGHPDFCKLFACDCAQAERQERTQQQLAARLSALAGVAGIFAGKTFDAFAARAYPAPVEWSDLRGAGTRMYSPELQQRAISTALAAAQSWAANPSGGMLFQGPVGSGKTHLAFAIAGELVRQRGVTVAADSLPALLQFIRNGFADNSAGQRIDDLKNADLLILDDIGAEHSSAWTEEQVFQIVNHRYVFRRWTIFTTNLPVELLPGRIGSRIAEFADIVPVIACDYRTQRRKQ